MRDRSQTATVGTCLKSARQSGSSDGLRVCLGDLRARAKVLARIERLIGGNPGDVKPVGAGVSELRIDCGPGYRVYFLQRGTALIILLAGGDKSSQAKDIDEALLLAANLTEET
ncbi:type II toxin-antitoxin system RelE/ParE family toxin [Synechococcus sp. MW101C3]|uniref:type II toxin-antitoxin system RelE/ParE family toxin n=1 Tax=Synechococcus sp. MW101C3 TaxID=210768 RepID=UPI001E44E025|nr:type II toxin-antitoxin system RelE/ParE family toxin [Synechococcus sp. MW101C3]